MDYLDFLAINEIVLIDNWRLAPLGTLLQVGHGHEAYVCMRIVFDAANGPSDTFVSISGSNAGEVFYGADLQSAPVVDVTALLEIGGYNPQGFFAGPMNPPPTGSLIKHADRGDVFVFGRDAANTTYHVCVQALSNYAQLGYAYLQMDRSRVFGISQKVGIRRRQEFT